MLTTEETKRVVSLRVLHSKLVSLGAPEHARRPLEQWIDTLESDLRRGLTADSIAVTDSANITLSDIRGPKQ